MEAWIIRSGQNNFWAKDKEGYLIMVRPEQGDTSSSTNLVFNSKRSAEAFSMHLLETLPKETVDEIMSYGEIAAVKVEAEDVHNIH